MGPYTIHDNNTKYNIITFFITTFALLVNQPSWDHGNTHNSNKKYNIIKVFFITTWELGIHHGISTMGYHLMILHSNDVITMGYRSISY